jgi:hypothetical protein
MKKLRYSKFQKIMMHYVQIKVGLVGQYHGSVVYTKAKKKSGELNPASLCRSKPGKL